MDSGCHTFFFYHQQYWASIPERFYGDVEMCAKVRYHTVGVCELGAGGMRSQRRLAPIGPPGGERVTMCSGWWNVCYTCWPEFSDWFTSYQASPWRSGSKVLGGHTFTAGEVLCRRPRCNHWILRSDMARDVAARKKGVIRSVRDNTWEVKCIGRFVSKVWGSLFMFVSLDWPFQINTISNMIQFYKK